MDLKHITRNPAAYFKKKRLPRVEKKPMITHTAEQSARFLSTIKHTRMYWPVVVALATGMRRGEVLALRWRNVDFMEGTIRVEESLEQTKSGLRFKDPKSGKGRSISLPAYAVEELRRHKREQAEELLALGIRQSDATLVCRRADPFDGDGKADKLGAPLPPRSCSHEFTRLIEGVADIPRIGFHGLRHSHATQLLGANVHPKVVQERLVHASILITMDLYSHAIPNMQESAAAKLDAAMQSAMSAPPMGNR